MTIERRLKLEMKEVAMRKSIVTVLAALTASAMFVAPAAAEEVSVTVPYGDLDLTAEAGAATLDQRIDAAVRQVCAKPDIRDIKANIAWEECKSSAKDGAMEQLSVLEPYESMALASLF